MRNAVLSCALIALAVLSAEARLAHNRDILAQAKSKSEAETEGKGTTARISAAAKSTDGVATATGKAYSKVDTRAVNAVAVAITEAYALVKGGEPAVAAVDAKAVAVGEAFALAYAAAYAHVFSSGEHNVACVKVFADGYAAATAFAKAYAAGVAKAKNKYGEIVVDGSAEAFAAATAKAYAAAEAEVCVKGKGEAEAFQESLAYSLVKPIASAMVKALAAVDSVGVTSGYVDVASDSKTKKEETFAASRGHAGLDIIKGSGYADAKGEAAAAGDHVPACPKDFPCCYPPVHAYHHSYHSSNRCNCGYYCTAFVKVLKAGYETKKVWTVKNAHPYYGNYKKGYQCICH